MKSQDNQAPAGGVWHTHPVMASLAVILCIVAVPHMIHAAEGTSEPCKIGFSSSLLTQVNENDARIAFRILAEVVSKQWGIPGPEDTVILRSDSEVEQALMGKKVDFLGIDIMEYSRLQGKIKFDPVFLACNNNSETEKYLLIARRDGPIRSVGDLRSRSIRIYKNARACLSPRWINTLLVKHKLPPLERFAGQIVAEQKLDRVVLPVFFRQTDACIITKSGFDGMVELNPQLSQQTSIIAESAEYVTGMLAFRADYNPTYKEQLISSIVNLNNTPSGQQVLTLFRTDKLDLRPVSFLEPTLQFIAEYERMTGRTSKP
jgi:phosphonate transport system substrate-binding protein